MAEAEAEAKIDSTFPPDCGGDCYHSSLQPIIITTTTYYYYYPTVYKTPEQPSVCIKYSHHHHHHHHASLCPVALRIDFLPFPGLVSIGSTRIPSIGLERKRKEKEIAPLLHAPRNSRIVRTLTISVSVGTRVTRIRESPCLRR